jgi:hypothetical protein
MSNRLCLFLLAFPFHLLPYIFYNSRQRSLFAFPLIVCQ